MKPQAESRARTRREDGAHLNQDGKYLWPRPQTVLEPWRELAAPESKSCLDFLFILFCQAEQKYFFVSKMKVEFALIILHW